MISFAYAQDKDDSNLYIDCQNHCAFSEMKYNCHGIAFKREKKGKTEFLYTHHNHTMNACVYFETYTIPTFKKINYSKVQTLCDCEEKNIEVPSLTQPMSLQTAKELVQLKMKISNWARCAPDPLTIAINPGEGEYTPEQLGICKEMRQLGLNPYAVLGGCQEGTFWNYCHYYGNTNIFAGPLCMAGDMNMCNDIKKNQNPDTGAWYRSAYQRRFPYSERGQPLFSRDEFLGMLMYFATTKDKEAAKKWLIFLRDNPKKDLLGIHLGNIFKVHNICAYHHGDKPSDVTDEQWKKMQADDRCELRPDSWGLLYKVYSYIGFSKSELKSISKKMYRKMRRNRFLIRPTNWGSALSVPRYTYETGLQAITVQLLRFIGQANKFTNSAARTINRKTDFMSPYYQFLAQGNKATEYGAYLIKKYCPSERPNYAHPPQGGIGVAAASFFDSNVNFFGGQKDGWQANQPTGHDCLGWINLYLKSL